MSPEALTAPPGSRSDRLRILLPIAILVACLTAFLALFWYPGGHGRKGHGRSSSSAGSDRSPVGGSDEGNSRATSGGTGGSPVGGGPSRSASGGKGEVWWYQKNDKQRRGAGEEAWWAPGPRGRKPESGHGSPRGGSPVGGGDRDEASKARQDRAEDQAVAERDARKTEPPARASTSNPGEVAGQRGGPDDFWWRN